jgi:hypothetical protein
VELLAANPVSATAVTNSRSREMAAADRARGGRSTGEGGARGERGGGEAADTLEGEEVAGRPAMEGGRPPVEGPRESGGRERERVAEAGGDFFGLPLVYAWRLLEPINFASLKWLLCAMQKRTVPLLFALCCWTQPYMVLRDGARDSSGWAPRSGSRVKAQFAHPLGRLVEINTNSSHTTTVFTHQVCEATEHGTCSSGM